MEALLLLQVPPPVASARVMDDVAHTLDGPVMAAGAGFPVVYVINTEADMAEGRRLVREGGGLAFILLRVKEGPATHLGKKNLVPHIERDRFRAALLG